MSSRDFPEAENPFPQLLLHGMPVRYLNENENEVSPESENEILQPRPRYRATAN